MAEETKKKIEPIFVETTEEKLQEAIKQQNERKEDENDSLS